MVPIYMLIQMSQSGCYFFFNRERKSLISDKKKFPKATGISADFEGSGFLTQTLYKADPSLKRVLYREEAYSLLNSPLPHCATKNCMIFIKILNYSRTNFPIFKPQFLLLYKL